MTSNPPDDDRENPACARRRQRWTLYVAVFALAVAIGHVVYAFIRDHVAD